MAAFAVFMKLWFAHTPAIAQDSKRAAQSSAESRYRKWRVSMRSPRYCILPVRALRACSMARPVTDRRRCWNVFAG
jgi:hypothetical protein